VVHERLRPNELNPEEHVKRRAELEKEVVANKVNDYDFETNIIGTLAGRKFEIEINPGDVREMMVTKVSAGGTKHDAPPADYSNKSTFMPLVDEGGQAVNVRPTKPVDEKNHFGLYRCEIVAIENNPVDVDQYMRCRVKFPWDAREDEPKPTYFSVMQPMGGTHQGTQWFPREGDHCVVTFIGGQHEQPVIVGCLYDKELPPPEMGPDGLVLPESRSWIGFTHCSIGDKSRKTMLNMKLDAGDELVYWHAPWDWLEEVDRDAKIDIKRDETRIIGRDFDETVKRNYTQHVKGDRKETVDGDYDLTVKGDTTFSMKGGSTNTVSGAVKNNFKSGLKETIMSGAKEMVMTGSRSFTVPMGNFSITSGRVIQLTAPRLSLAVASVGFGAAGTPMGGQLDITSKAELRGPVSATIRGGSSQVRADGTGVRVEGPSTHISDGMGGSTRLNAGKYVVDAPQGIEFRCGLNTMRLAPDGLYINGARLNIDATQTELRTTAFDIIGPEPDDDGVA
ncbi:MAG: hypothetical protein KDK70_23330, partial [Myxococcales bacterium]|nr:hypothetical protein [Myxococcales bacterium]